MSFALTIPELLENIFLHADQVSVLRSLFVCKQWYIIGRSVLWRNVEGPKHFRGLVLLLGRLLGFDDDETDTTQVAFVRYPQAVAWSRFEKHAHCVRVMSLKDLQKYREVFHVMAEAKPSFALFPNLRTLKYTATHEDIQHCIHFLHSNVKRFIFSTTGPPNYPPQKKQLYYDHLRFLVDAIPRMSAIQHIEFIIDSSSNDITIDRFVGVIKHIPTLESVVLPRYTLTASILAEFASLPRLSILQTQSGAEGSWTASDPFEPDLPPDSFPALKKLTLSATPLNVARFLSQHPVAARLHTLALDLDEVEPEGLPTLLHTVASRCTALCAISIERRGSNSFELNWDSIIPPLTLNSFAPILRRAALTDIKIEHEGLFRFTPAELNDFAGRIPHVERLVLHGLPTSHLSEIRLPDLLVFARRCPALTTLGLVIDASKVDDLPSVNLPEFKSLRCLDLGGSYIGSDTDSVSFFLARICPLGCKLETWENQEWRPVIDVVPLLVKMRVFHSGHPTEKT
ncbi:hypothetical protein Hypma_013234 [Hypsizygus marmoreus]|uniref:F-box domain-containing protein n=1 Tax=Hypsizygus marmoreus TaxID=39966 RepID=A0A369JCB2_HYPMA|nr:hypothetical protein Hypma_013234 [Hypsizygus marmoreus]